MDFIPYRIASGTDQETKNHLRVGVLAILGPSRDTNVVLAGLKIHRGGVVEYNAYAFAENFPGLIVCYFLHFMLDIVCVRLAFGLGTPAQLIQVAVNPVLIIVLVHEVRHVTERLQFAAGAIETGHYQALENVVVGCPDRVEPYLVEKTTIDKFRSD